jgi:hypothetical protein
MSITTWWRGRGQHRAADRIPVLTAERDLWAATALLLAAQLARRTQQLANADTLTGYLGAQVDGLTIERDELCTAWEAADARAREAAADLANLKAIRVPAAADHDLPRAAYDADETIPTPVVPLWLGLSPNAAAA